MRKTITTLAAALTLGGAPAHALVTGKPVHGLTLYGEPKLPADFPYYPYANPDAPKGGTMVRSAIGTFDSFNAFSFKGNKPHPGIIHAMGNGWFFYFNEPLMVHGSDEPWVNYCLICETVEVAPDRRSMEFALRPEARFHDGTPVTVEDVIFSFETLMTKGHPRYKLYWGDVTKVEKTGEHKVRFTFKDDKNTELPMLMGELPVLSRAFWKDRDFEAVTLEVPVATGPYRIDRFEAGRYFVLKRDPNYWGKDLPVNRGAYNFDELRVEYFRDDDVAFQAFQNGSLDTRVEVDAARWATGYDKSLIDGGAIVQDSWQDGQPDEKYPFVMNTRRPHFADRRVRRALALAFDFDGANKTVGYGLMQPFSSFWQGSELASRDLPQGEELAILEKYRGRVPDEVFTTPFTPPRTPDENALRQNLLEAQKLLAEAGWQINNGVLTNKTGETFQFEVLLRVPVFERWVGPYLRNLERLGVKASMRIVDPAQYLNRMNEFDFDMTVGEQPFWGGMSNSPGNEQRENWGSEAAGHNGSENWIGVKDPVVDEIIESLIKAQSRESLVAHTHALDRILLWNYYVVPSYAKPDIWWARWARMGRPDITPFAGQHPALWWYDAEKAAKVNAFLKSRAAPSESGGSSSNRLLLALAGAAVLVVGFLAARRFRRV